ncbi:hypothetical protein C8Q70DRAFT_918338 [Cubamyces menziesii]|nr:hypothetical protein C8Q70DRAFT_918338 [Cubamyces menziesii]
MSFNDAIAGPVALSPYALSPTMTIPTSSPEPSNAAAFSPTMPSPVIASPVTVTARRFRGAWDDPPPTPEYRPLSLRMSQLATFVHPEALDIAQPAPPAEEGAVQRNPRFRDSVLGDGRSEAEGDQLPEYSRY